MQAKELNPRTLKRIGIVFFCCIITVLILFLIIVQGILFNKYYPVTVRFNFIGAVKSGANVRFIGGPVIGYISKIIRKDNKIDIILKIQKSFKLRKKAEISIYTHGMMGDRYIEISQTKHSGDYAKPGDMLIGNDAVSFEIFQMNLTRFQMDMDFFNPWNRKPPENLVIILGRLQDNLNFFSYYLRRIRPGARASIKNYRKRTDIFKNKIDRMKKDIAILKRNIKSFAGKDVKSYVVFFSEFEEQVRNSCTSIENLLNTTKAFRDETSLIIKRKNIEGRLIFDDEHYDKIKDKMEDFEEFSEEIADNPAELFFR